MAERRPSTNQNTKTAKDTGATRAPILWQFFLYIPTVQKNIKQSPETALWVQSEPPYGGLNPQIADDLQEEYQALDVS